VLIEKGWAHEATDRPTLEAMHAEFEDYAAPAIQLLIDGQVRCL